VFRAVIALPSGTSTQDHEPSGRKLAEMEQGPLASQPASQREPAVGSGEFYDAYWHEDDEWNRVHPGNRHRARLVITELARILGLGQDAGAGLSLLDVGCGNGLLLRRIASRFPKLELYGEDVSPAAVELASDVARETFVHDLGLSPLPTDRRFDLVVMTEVLEHVSDPAAFLRNLRRSLAPGASVVLTVPTGATTAFDRMIGHHRHYTLAELDELCSDADYRTVRAYRWGFPFFSLYRTIAWMLGDRARAARPTDHGLLGRSATGLMYASFFLCVKSQRIGRQVVAVIHPSSGEELPAK